MRPQFATVSDKEETPPEIELIALRQASRRSYNLISLSDESVAYLQAHVNLAGPDGTLNARIRKELNDPSIWRMEFSQTPKERIHFRSYDEGSFDPRDVDALIRSGPLPVQAESRFVKFSMIRDRIKKPGLRALCFGAGDGLEGLILSLMNPSAEISCTDFSSPSKPHFPIQPVPHFELVKKFPLESFDFIFSHHAIEHILDVRSFVKDMFRLLKPGGTFASALPVECHPSNPNASRFDSLIRSTSPFRFLDLKPGHAWKTDAFGIYDALTSAGLSSVEFYSWTAGYVIPEPPGLRQHLKDLSTPPMPLGKMLSFLKRLFTPPIPKELFLKLFYSLESRSPRFRQNPIDELFFVCSKAL